MERINLAGNAFLSIYVLKEKSFFKDHEAIGVELRNRLFWSVSMIKWKCSETKNCMEHGFTLLK